MNAGDDTLDQRSPDSRPSEVARVIEQVRSARFAGERLDDQTVISAHAELMPELGLELAKLKRIESAWAAAALPPAPAGDETPALVGPAEIELASALAADLERPTIEVPGYTVLREIGRGGQAVVFLAFKLNPGRRVALKVMRDGSLADDRTLARFELEAGVLAKLEHRNIVSIIETGQTADGSQYFAMNYIAGCGLDEYMRQYREKSPDDPGKLLGLFLRICDAVNAAHRLSFVHRDLKPSNIRVDEQGEPHVLDFGLARTVGPRTAVGEPVSITGEFLGSLPWCSPEQAEGEPARIDVRTDVYSLGVILYQMLTGGRFPYEVVGNVRDVLNNIVTTEPTPPSKVIAADLAKRASGRREVATAHPPTVNAEIERIVLKALAKQPEQRYQSAGELGRAVADYLLGRKIVAPAAAAMKPQRRARGRSSRRRIAVIATTIITLALGGVLWQMLSSDGDQMRPSWLFKRLFLALTSSVVVASPVPRPASAAGPTGSSTSIFDFGNDLPSPSTSVQPATRPGNRSDPTAVEPATAPATPPATADAPARLRLPTKEEQTAAERLIREAYSKQYADPAPAAKAALAADLLRQADDPSNSPAAQFVLLRDAADISARVGDARTSMIAVTAAARRYRLEPSQELMVRASGMALAARAATDADSLKEIAGQSLGLSESALRMEQFDTADRLVAAAGMAAAKTKDAALIRSVQDQSRDLNTARVASNAARAAADVLAKNPADLAANLTLGRYRCLVLGDWDGGLPLLARGSDSTLKALAARDLARGEPASAVEVGDGWWDLAEKQQGASKRACQARAGYWYQAALPTLGGLIKARVERRIEIAGSTAGPAPVPPADLDVFTNSIGMKFVRIKPGTFVMGSPGDEEGREGNETQHEVKLTKSFMLATTTVTQEQWQAVMGMNPSRFKGGKLPVEKVSWEDAVDFCKRLSQKEGKPYRLPTEAEWEYACRAGTTTAFNTGDSISTEQANYNGRGNGGHGRFRETTTPVGSFAPNKWGLYDMHGNVLQWCYDVYGKYASTTAVDPVGLEQSPNASHVMRGGSWYSPRTVCRSAQRGSGPSDLRRDTLGFRVVSGLR